MPHPSFEEVFGQKSISIDFPLRKKPRAILLTGSKGMVGNSVAKALNSLQKSGVLTDTKLLLCSREWSKEDERSWERNCNLELIANTDISKIQDQVEIVIHTASPSNITKIDSYEELHYSNIGILEEILRLEPKKFIYISSGEVYKKDPTIEGTSHKHFLKSNKRDWYPMVKLETEMRLEKLTLEGRFDAAVLRLFHTYGPGVKRKDGRSFADILWGATLDGEITLHSSGKQVRSFLYLSDAVEAIIKVSFAIAPGYFVANLGSEVPVTIREFAEEVSSITGARINLNMNSEFDHSPNDHLVPIIQNMKSYDWSPKVENKLGIERTIAWIKKSIYQ